MVVSAAPAVAPGIHLLSDPLGDRRLNVYALEHDGAWALFDAGVPGMVSGRVARGDLTGDITLLVVSHADADHLGDTAALRDLFPHLRILCHARDCRWIENHDALVRERYDHARPRYGYGYPPEVLSVLRRLCGRDVRIDATLEDGATLRIGPREWRVLHVPGHSPGHLALWHEPDGVLLLGDAVLGFGPPGDGGRASMPPTHQFIDDYLRTIDRLAGLPVRLALSGHWPPLDGALFGRLLQESRACVERDLEALLDACSGTSMRFADLIGVLNDHSRSWSLSEDAGYSFALVGYLEYLTGQRRLREEPGMEYSR